MSININENGYLDLGRRGKVGITVSQKWLDGSRWARKFKKSRPKKLVKSNKSISRKKFFDQNPFFAFSKMVKNQFLNWEKIQKAEHFP